MIPFTLDAYRTPICTSIVATPCSLMYGMKAVLLIQVGIPSLQALSEIELKKQNGLVPSI